MVSGRRRLAGMATAGALGACCLAVIGCGGSSGSSAAADPLTGQTAREVLAEAVDGLLAAPSFTESSTGVDAGQYGTAYKEVVPGKGCTGTVVQGWLGAQGTVTYITIGETVYFKPDSTMWQTMAGTDAAKVIKLVDGRYVKDPLSDVRLHGLFSCVIFTPGKAVVTKGQVTTFNGIGVLPLKDPGGGLTYVTDTSKPEFVQVDDPPITGTSDPANETTYTVGAPVTLIPPPAKQVVSGASIGM
jgi:hypothetical protein